MEQTGTIRVAVRNERIRLHDLVGDEHFGWHPDGSHGAGNLFVGCVRNLNLGKQVVGVEYDCYVPMTIKVFRAIGEEAQERWGRDTNICILHRQGYLEIGEISVLIMVSTRHRDESYQASRYIIEEIKTRAPIWKKEFYTDGETEWVRGHALCQHGGGLKWNAINGKSCSPK